MLWVVWPFKILFLSFQEHGVSFNFFVSSLISFISISKLSHCKFFTLLFWKTKSRWVTCLRPERGALTACKKQIYSPDTDLESFGRCGAGAAEGKGAKWSGGQENRFRFIRNISHYPPPCPQGPCLKPKQAGPSTCPKTDRWQEA